MRAVLVSVSALVALVAVLGSPGTAARSEEAAACGAARVQYIPYAGGDRRLGTLPWVRGTPGRVGLVGLLWYWPHEWWRRELRTARIYTGGVAPAGHSMKILWVFLGRSARGRGGAQLVVRGRRLDKPGSLRQEFAAVFYSGQQGAPSYASIVDVPTVGCWRLQLSTGTLHASVVFQAVTASEQPALRSPDEVETLVEQCVGAFDAGHADELDRIFAREPDFEWYSTNGPGERLDPVARDRPSLVPYLRDRQARGEKLTLRSLTFNGNTTGARTYGNFVYTLTRSADDLPPTPYRGKGAALCYPNRPDTIFVWSMGPE